MKDVGRFKARLGKSLSGKKILSLVIIIVSVAGLGSGACLVKASENPTFCTNCHIMKPYFQSWKDSNLLANKHAAAGATCHDCHESSIAIQAEEGWKFITGNYKVPLDKLTVTQDFCLKCHSASGTGTPKGMTFEDAKSKTNFEQSNPHHSHNGKQDCILCHSMHKQSEVMCAQCHQFKWMDNLDSSWAKN